MTHPVAKGSRNRIPNPGNNRSVRQSPDDGSSRLKALLDSVGETAVATQHLGDRSHDFLAEDVVCRIREKCELLARECGWLTANKRSENAVLRKSDPKNLLAEDVY